MRNEQLLEFNRNFHRLDADFHDLLIQHFTNKTLTDRGVGDYEFLNKMRLEKGIVDRNGQNLVHKIFLFQ